jgi:hypothetical protein
MDDPFAMALEDLADSELGSEFRYQMKAGGPPFPVRARLSRVEDRADTPRGPGVMVIRTEAVITKTAMDRYSADRPQEGDLLGQGSAFGWKVGKVRQDERGLSWVLNLIRRD